MIRALAASVEPVGLPDPSCCFGAAPREAAAQHVARHKIPACPRIRAAIAAGIVILEPAWDWGCDFHFGTSDGKPLRIHMHVFTWNV